MEETLRVIICDECGIENPIGKERCSCGNLLSLIRPVFKNESKSCEVRRFIRCRSCKTKHYDISLKKCPVCTVLMHDVEPEIETNEEATGVTCDVYEEGQRQISDDNVRIPLILKSLNHDKRITVEGDSILGRLGSVEPKFFSEFPYVSRTHCRVFFESGRWFVEDNGSSGGTRVNGSVINRKHPLNTGDVLSMANAHFKVEL